jgi:glyoxylase-like metal-dependent hydrolase (beta-lactamase superfamily II)
MTAAAAPSWLEVGDRVFVRRYRFFDQAIGLVLGDGAALLIDTRTTPGHARELLDDVRTLTDLPIDVIVNTHGHSDHCFGNASFDPVRIWGQRGAVRFLATTGERQKAALIASMPDLEDDVRAVVIRPPDTLVDREAAVSVGGRPVTLAFLGRAHTDHDLVVAVPDAGVVFAGDIIEEGNAPWFGDGYPLDWPSTLDAFLACRLEPVVVPGHGAVVDRAFVERQRGVIEALAVAIRGVWAGEITADDVIAMAVFPEVTAREALARGLDHLREGPSRPDE